VMKAKLQFALRRKFGAAGFIRIAPAMFAIAALALATPPVFAQASLDAVSASAPAADAVSASDTFAPAAGAAIVAPDSGYALPPPDDGSLAVPTLSSGDLGTGDSGTDDAAKAAPAADGTPGDALPGGAPPIDLASPLGGIAPVAAADGGPSPSSHSGWDRVGDSESYDDSGDSGSQVLELPRAVPPDASPASGNGEAAQDGDSSSADEVGSVDDYQDAQDDSVIGVYIAPPNEPPVLNPPFGVGTFGNQAPANAPVQPNNGPMIPSGVGGIRPFAGGMNSAIMPTSPMYPRGMPMVQSYGPMVLHNSAPIPGGWWNRAR
jgi:hypothetical protein